MWELIQFLARSVLAALVAICAGGMLVITGILLNYLYVDYIRWDASRMLTKAERFYREAKAIAEHREYLEAQRFNNSNRPPPHRPNQPPSGKGWE